MSLLNLILECVDEFVSSWHQFKCSVAVEIRLLRFQLFTNCHFTFSLLWIRGRPKYCFGFFFKLVPPLVLFSIFPSCARPADAFSMTDVHSNTYALSVSFPLRAALSLHYYFTPLLKRRENCCGNRLSPTKIESLCELRGTKFPVSLSLNINEQH